MDCPHCQHPAGQAAFCENCGQAHAAPAAPTPAPKLSMSCSCEAPDFDGSDFCMDCGMKRAVAAPAPWPTRHGQRLDARLAVLSDIGKRHESNQDAGSVARVGDFALLAVCDGVSNSQTPELASRAAADAWISCAMEALGAGTGQPAFAKLSTSTSRRLR